MTRTKSATRQVWPCRVVERAPTVDELRSIIVTTDRVDRMRDSVPQDHLDFTNWLRSGGPVLWGHEYRGEHGVPIAKALQVRREGRGHRMSYRFLEHEFARKVQVADDAGVLSASIGFQGERRPNEHGGWDYTGPLEIFEVSLTPVPANPDCHKTLTRLGLATSAAVTREVEEEHILVTADAVRDALREALAERIAERQQLRDVLRELAEQAAHQVVCRLTGRVD